jgi:hypothetical protein
MEIPLDKLLAMTYIASKEVSQCHQATAPSIIESAEKPLGNLAYLLQEKS